MSYKPAYERAIRLAKLFKHITHCESGGRSYNAVFEVVWYRTAGIPLADKFKA